MFTSIENFLRAAEITNKVRAERNEPFMRVEVDQGIIEARTRAEMKHLLVKQYGEFAAHQIFKNLVIAANYDWGFDRVPYINGKGELCTISVDFIEW